MLKYNKFTKTLDRIKMENIQYKLIHNIKRNYNSISKIK